LVSSQYLLDAVRAVVLAGGFAVAAVSDLRTREVPERLWQVLGVVAFLLGAIVLAPGGTLPMLLWLLVGVWTVQHFFPWDDALGPRLAAQAIRLELATYAAVLAVVAGAVVRWGIGPSAVPIPVVAVVVSVVIARLLFETPLHFGGADAMAVMAASLLVPVVAAPLLYAPALAGAVASWMPFAVTMLTNAALFAVLVPVFVAVRNASRGEFTLRRGFLSYTLPVEELPRRFVWVQDAPLDVDTMVDDADTSEEDTRRRTELARELEQRGVRQVWVTPQIPFLAFLAAGAIAGLLAGNLLLDLLLAL